MRPFILLELLIAFALVSASALPFIRYPLKHLKQEIDTLFLMELSRVAEGHLAEIRAEVCSGKITGAPEHSELYRQESLTLELPKNFKRIYQKQIFLKSERKKMTQEGEEFHLLSVRIAYKRSAERKAVLNADLTLFLSREEKK